MRFPFLALPALIFMLPAVIMNSWSGNVSYPRSSDTLLIVPARPGVLQLAFDLAKMRDISIVSFRDQAAAFAQRAMAEKPLLHIWTGSDWQYLSFDDFCSLRFAAAPPGKVIVIGDDQTVPKALLQGMTWAAKIERLSTMNAADLINQMDPYFQFNPREWKRLADSYGLKLKDLNAPQAKQLQEANASRPGKNDTYPAVPAEKYTAATADNETPRSNAQDNLFGADALRSQDYTGQVSLESSDLSAIAPKNILSPSGDSRGLTTGHTIKPKSDHKLHLHLGENEDILFIRIAPLSIWVGQYEVTNAQYERFNRAHDPKRYYDHILNLPDQPAVLVSWEDANNYCGWLNRNFKSQLPTGFEFRLPTEKEWNAFAACGREAKYPWGDQWPPPNSFNYKGTEGASIFYGLIHNEKFIRGHDDGFIVAARVGESGTNEWGLYGVGGNVWEWCQDWFDETKMTRVLKGAAWNNYEPEILAISNRSDALPEKSNAMIGFRVVIAPQKKMKN